MVKLEVFFNLNFQKNDRIFYNDNLSVDSNDSDAFKGTVIPFHIGAENVTIAFKISS